EGWLSGIDEAIAILKLCVDDWSALTVHALYEGDGFDRWDTVMTIEGPYEAFAHLETLCLGVLSRRTRVCTNATLLAQAAQSKPVLFFGARDDMYATQPGDGYAAMVGGVKMVSTDAQASLFAGKSVGTIPHALIAAYGGDTVKATKRFAEQFESVDVIALVDYDNDSVKTSLDVTRALVWNVRNALDAEDFGDVKIVVSGGFDAERVRAFEDDGVPVDAYGVGAALFDGRWDFTADVVQVNGKAEAKAGRRMIENPKLERVK